MWVRLPFGVPNNVGVGFDSPDDLRGCKLDWSNVRHHTPAPISRTQSPIIIENRERDTLCQVVNKTNGVSDCVLSIRYRRSVTGVNVGGSIPHSWSESMVTGIERISERPLAAFEKQPHFIHCPISIEAMHWSYTPVKAEHYRYRVPITIADK